MPPKTGSGSSYGVAKETTGGTYVAPSRHFGFADGTGITPNKEFDDQSQNVAGSIALRQEDVIENVQSGTAKLNGLVKAARFGLIFDQLTGDVVTPTISGAVRTYLFNIGLTKPDGKFLTHQLGFEGTSAATLLGGQATSLRLMMNAKEALKFELESFGREVQMGTGSPAKAAPVYTSSEGFGFRNAALTINGGSIGSCVKAADLTIAIPRDTGRHCINGTGKPLEAVTNDDIAVTGNLTMEWDSDAQLDAFMASSWRALKLQCLTASDIAAGVKGECTVDLPAFQITGHPIEVSGKGVLTTQVPIRAAVTGASPLASITYKTLDTAL